jgi:hypothetical protein
MEEHTEQTEPVNSEQTASSENNVISPVMAPQSIISKPVTKRKSRKKIIIIVVSVVAVLTIAVVAAWYFLIYKPASTKSSKVSGISSQKPKSSASAETDPQVIKFITPTTGEKWLASPVPIAKQGYFVVQDPSYDLGESVTDYFSVGTHGDNTIIMTKSPGTISYIYYLFEKYPDGRVVLVNHPDGLAVYNTDYDSYLSTTLDPKVKVVNDIHYDSLTIPDKISIDSKGSVVMPPDYPNIGYDYVEPGTNSTGTVVYTEVKKLGNSTLYRSEGTNAQTGLVSISYFIKTPLGTEINLRYEPLDLSLRDYQWSTGYASSSDSLRAISHGCSSLTASVTKSGSITESQVEKIGKSGKGLTVYGFKDTNNSLFQKAYTEFKDYMQYDTTNSNKDISAADFNKQHAVVLFRDVNDQWLVYVRGDFSPAYGCAKPVIYLYPQTEQKVTVRVGADVKVSDPFYDPSTGWSAVAKPNGQLTVNGATYNSLFWEGPGYGRYPEITEGAVVKQKDLTKTIQAQLATQGLNKNEIGDFMDYWKDKLPTKPYVRLTWFNTSQMNQLAPLFVYPKPDTTIRVFLDASGLDKPIKLPSQRLTSIPRKGFTLVEWGGLPSHRLY